MLNLKKGLGKKIQKYFIEKRMFFYNELLTKAAEAFKSIFILFFA